MQNYTGPVYGNSNRFQFILEFTNDSGLAEISVRQRVILSAYLTALTKGIPETKKNLFDIIFNFDQTARADKIMKSSFYEKFVSDLSVLLLKHPEIFPYIKNNADKLNDAGKTLIYRSQIDSEQYALIRQSKNTYQSFMAKLYMIGVAKNNRITKLNTISIFEFSKDKINVSRVKKLAEKFLKEAGLDSDLFDSKNKNFQFYRNKKSGKQTKTDKVEALETQAKKYLEDKENSKAMSEEIPEQVEQTTQIPEEDDQGAFDFENVAKVDDLIAKFDDRPKSYLDLGEDRRFSSDLIDRALSYGETHPGYFSEKFEASKKNLTMKQIHDLNNVLLDNGKMSITGMLKEFQNLSAVLRGGDLGPNWKEIKDTARNEQSEMKINLANKLNKLYDKNIDMYWYVVWYVLARHKEALKIF